LARCSEGLSLNQIEDKILMDEFDETLYRISKISGVDVKSDEIDFELLKEELIIYLKNFGYLNYTVEEILLAVRLNSTPQYFQKNVLDVEKIKCSVKYLNVSYLSEVLANYSQLRVLVEKKVKNIIDGY